MNFATRIALLATMAGVLAGNLAAQEGMQPSAINIIEAKLSEVKASIVEMTQEEETLRQEIASRALVIQELKSKTQLNYLERQRLERLLQESQDLSGQISQLALQVRRVQGARNQLAMELLKQYEAEINRQLKMLADTQLAKAVRDSSYRRIERWRQHRDQLQQELKRPSDAVMPIRELRIEQHDTPKRIRQKADLLRDLEDKQRQFSERVGKRINELQKEEDLRNRIDELVTDLSLFDQQEETLGNVETGQSATLESTEDFAGIRQNSQTDAFVLIGPPDFSFSSLSEGEFEDVILQLRQQQTLADARADSLARQAERFNKAADDFQKQ